MGQPRPARGTGKIGSHWVHKASAHSAVGGEPTVWLLPRNPSVPGGSVPGGESSHGALIPS